MYVYIQMLIFTLPTTHVNRGRGMFMRGVVVGFHVNKHHSGFKC